MVRGLCYLLRLRGRHASVWVHMLEKNFLNLATTTLRAARIGVCK